MSIDRYAGRMELACDDCGNGVLRRLGPDGKRTGRTYGSDEFEIMIADAKEAGWSITREDSVWRHYCDDCKGSHRVKERQLF